MIDSTFLRHEKCPSCKSKDNVGVWEDSLGNVSKFCFTDGCGFSEGVGVKAAHLDLPSLEYKDLTNRGINQRTCLKYGVGVHEKELYQPYYKDGKIFACKVKKHPKDFYWVGTNPEHILFGSHLVKKHGKQLIITEGELDALAAFQMTRIPSVSIPNGSSNARKSILKNLELIESFKKVYICFDSDEAGTEATDAVMEVIRAGKAFRVNLQRKDACDYLMNGDVAGFRESLATAQPRRLNAYYSEDKLHEKYLKFFSGGEDKGTPTGIPELDKFISFRKGELTTIYANPSVGKSTLVRQISANWVNMGKKVLLCPFEERDIKYFVMTVGMVFGKKILAETLDIGEREEMFNKVKGNLFLSTLTNTTQPDDLLTMLEYSVRSEEIDLVIFDNITKFTACSPNQTQSIQEVMSILVTVAQACGCHVVCVSHTRRDKDLDEGEAPQMYSAFNSGAIERFSDIVLTMGRKLDSNLCEVAVRKDRNDNRVGEFNLHYDPVSATFVTDSQIKYHNKGEETDAQSESERDSIRFQTRSTGDGSVPRNGTDTVKTETKCVHSPSSDGVQSRRSVQGETSHHLPRSEGSVDGKQSESVDEHPTRGTKEPEIRTTKCFPTVQTKGKVKYMQVAR